MLKLNLLLITGMIVLESHAFAEPCDIAKAARQAVKALVAIEDIKGITGYHGGVKDESRTTTTFNIQLYYEKTKDWYLVSIRNQDCRIISTELFAENIAR